MSASSKFSSLTGFGKIIILVLVGAMLYGAYWFVFQSGKVIKTAATESITVGSVSLPTTVAPDGSIVAAKQNLPTDEVSTINAPHFHTLIWEWNSQMGEIYSNGGAKTTKGSLMERNGVFLEIERQDDVPTMQQQLIKSAQDAFNNPGATKPFFVQIMGDAAGQFMAAVQPTLLKIDGGKGQYTAQIIGSVGFSNGEDKLQAPAAWKQNPQLAKGSVISTVLRDGDWNIVVKWAGDNGIAINPDEKTYDPNAINFVAAPDYIKAGELYISGHRETRPVVINGKLTPTKKDIGIDGVSSWTPVDVNVAEKKGGLATIVSTKEYRNQMPCVIIGIKKVMEDNSKGVSSMLTAILQGGDQVNSYSDVAQKAGDLSAKVYNDQTGAYWLSYYNGVTKADKTGQIVELGGSHVMNLADNEVMYGLGKDTTNVYAIVYTTFGNLVTKLYPQIVPSIPGVRTVLNLTFLKAAIANAGSNPLPAADKVTFDAGANVTRNVAEKSWNIAFVSGSADFTPEALTQLDAIFNTLVVANNVKVQVHGHTDNSGQPAQNDALSLARARAVKNYLEGRSQNNFGAGRVSTFAHGANDPIAPNTTAAGKAKNRRVTIKQVI